MRQCNKEDNIREGFGAHLDPIRDYRSYKHFNILRVSRRKLDNLYVMSNRAFIVLF